MHFFIFAHLFDDLVLEISTNSHTWNHFLRAVQANPHMTSSGWHMRVGRISTHVDEILMGIHKGTWRRKKNYTFQDNTREGRMTEGGLRTLSPKDRAHISITINKGKCRIINFAVTEAIKQRTNSKGTWTRESLSKNWILMEYEIVFMVFCTIFWVRSLLEIFCIVSLGNRTEREI